MTSVCVCVCVCLREIEREREKEIDPRASEICIIWGKEHVPEKVCCYRTSKVCPPICKLPEIDLKNKWELKSQLQVPYRKRWFEKDPCVAKTPHWKVNNSIVNLLFCFYDTKHQGCFQLFCVWHHLDNTLGWFTFHPDILTSWKIYPNCHLIWGQCVNARMKE